MKIDNIITVAAAVALLAGCSGQARNNANGAAAEQQPQPTITIQGFTDTVELEVVPWEETEPQESYFDSKAKSGAKAVTAAAGTQNSGNATASRKKDNGKAETIYVETDDSRGRVWGHVTMKGDRGTGTVHDEGENTWAVSVTRHGNELYAVDQNSRQYVFKLKK